MTAEEGRAYKEKYARLGRRIGSALTTVGLALACVMMVDLVWATPWKTGKVLSPASLETARLRIYGRKAAVVREDAVVYAPDNDSFGSVFVLSKELAAMSRQRDVPIVARAKQTPLVRTVTVVQVDDLVFDMRWHNEEAYAMFLLFVLGIWSKYDAIRRLFHRKGKANTMPTTKL